MTRRAPPVAVLFGLGLPASCGSPTASSTDAIVTFRVANETFRVRLTTAGTYCPWSATITSIES